MINQLSQQKKLLLIATFAVFILAALLILQTYFTMQKYNAAHSHCSAIKPGDSLRELINHAKTKNQPLIETASGQYELGFAQQPGDTCGCEIYMELDRIKEIKPTFCR